jgi:molybdate transport system regulatory protein
MITLRITGRIWLEAPNGERFMGIGRLELLGHIQRTGSISQAAKEMKMSYKRAWELVNSMNLLAGEPLVSTQTGGSTGGGAVVTDVGMAYLSQYRNLQERFQAFLGDETAGLQQKL